MTTAQIVILSTFTLLIFISYIFSMLSETDNGKMLWGGLQILCTGFIIMIAFEMTDQREQAIYKLNSKCPELEKLENVYRIK